MDKTTVYSLVGFMLAFLGLGIAYFAIYLGIRQERLKRELEHKERMRALELGRSLPGDIPWLSPLRIGFLVAAVVPICAFAFACLSTHAVGFQTEIWKAAGIVSVFAVGCGSVVVCVAGTAQGQHQEAAAQVEKSPVEEDAYDVVSSRG
jgi:hypothetical protein